MSKNKYVVGRSKGMPVSDDELLEDLRRVAEEINRNTVPKKTYRKRGRFDDTTFNAHFQTWNAALSRAGLGISYEKYSDEKLFENILVLWQHYGRQPRQKELEPWPSIISKNPYKRRFGSWKKALERFVEFANASEFENLRNEKINQGSHHKTSRDPSLRLRYKVLLRDRFCCVQCGASPAKSPGVELHIDHVLAWSKGGETKLENLQTLCSKCNLGKGDQTTDLPGASEPITKKLDEQAHSPVAEPKAGHERAIKDLVKLGESYVLEFKSTFQWDVKEGKQNTGLRYSSLKTIAAFMNSKGGTLVIGVEDNGNIIGLEQDLKMEKGSKDKFEQRIASLILSNIGAACSTCYRSRFEEIDGKTVFVVDVTKSPKPVFLKTDKGKEFFVRASNTTRSLDNEETHKYVEVNW